MVVLTGFVLCGCVYVCFIMCGCFDNFVDVLVICVLVVFLTVHHCIDFYKLPP